MADRTNGWSVRDTLVLLVAFVPVFVFLMIRFKRVEQVFEQWFARFMRFVGALFVMTVPYIAFAWLSRVLLTRLWLQIGNFVLWGLLLAAALLLISTEKWRQRMLERLADYNIALPAAYSLQVLMLACLFFSSVGFLLVQNDRISLMRGSADAITPGSLSDFFLWHFLDAVPLLKVNATLGWQPPLTYDSASVGWMLLLFKAVVIVPVIGAFTWYGRREKAAIASHMNDRV